MSYHYWGHELEYHGAFPAPRLDEYLCRFCGLAVSGQAFRSGIALPKCDPLKRIRALERELAEARACGSPCPECRDLADLDAALRCSKERPKALAVFGHRWTGSARCAFCNVDRATVEKLSGFRLSPDAFTPKEKKPMPKPKPTALEVLRRALATATPEQQAGLAALIDVTPEAIRRAAERARSELRKPRHDVLGDMRDILDAFGGAWTLRIAEGTIHVRWDNGEDRTTVTRSVSECSLEQACAEALDVIESFTRPDGGLDL